MINDVLFEQLLQYLTDSYMKMADDKNEMIQEKVQLEVEKDIEENPLFGKKDTEKIKRLFSPFEDSFFEQSHKNSKKNSELDEKINNLEINVKSISLQMDKMKEYIDFVQMLEKLWGNSHKIQEIAVKKKGEFVEFAEDSNVSSDAKEMISSAISFLEYEYSGISFHFITDDNDYITSADENFNMVRILTYTISSTIESADVEKVYVELQKRENDMVISLQFTNTERLVGHYAYKTALTII